MGQPQASRRSVVLSDDEDEEPNATPAVPSDEDDEPVKPSRQASGKLKFRKTGKVQQPTPDVSTQGASSQLSPAKPKVTKTKSRTAAKDSAKANSKPIYSFFNAATQRQQKRLDPTPSPEKPFVSQDAVEAIHDDSGDEGRPVAFSKRSSTAMAMRKRKVQHVRDIGDDSSLPPPPRQKFRKTSDSGRTPSLSVMNEDKRPWVEQFAPVDLLELAVHKRKVQDVRQWLQTAINGRRQKVLVLKGAAGTGKTTTVALLAKDMGLEISEWRNPAGSDLTAEGSLSAASQFEEFVRRAGKTTGLVLSTSFDSGSRQENGETISDASPASGMQLLLVEEFPNTFFRTSSTLQFFRSAIMQYVSSPPVPEGSATPIIMIISETLLSTNTAAADSFTAHRLLGPELANHPYINTIEFNSVAPTILTKALETIVVKEARKSGRRKTPGPQVLQRLAETGDIRSAISSLEFLCLRGDDGDTWSSKVAFTKAKKAKTDPGLTKAEEEALKLITNRESTLGIFHAVGRVVYNNRIDPPLGSHIPQPPAWLPHHRREKVPERDMDALIDELGTDTPTFLAALHENYALSCCCSGTEETLDSLSGCIDNISDADLLSVDRFSFGTLAFSGSATDSLRQDEMSFQVAVRGVLFNLPSPVHRGLPPGGTKAEAHRMFYPRSLKLWKAKEEVEGTLELLTSQAQSGKLNHATKSHQAKTVTATSGVECWKRNDQSETQDNSPAEDGDSKLTTTKAEMLLERLPYMSLILAPRKDPLMDQIEKICRVPKPTAQRSFDEDIEPADADANLDMTAEQWSTDKPDVEPSFRATNFLPGHARGKRKQETEGGGLAIPVETSVEKLVLEDDDIVDE
jgi:cell cycle checkpoint protein